MTNFFIAGGQRCGTTYLATVLDEHPEIRMARPFRPEPKFFLDPEQVAKGRARYESLYFADVPETIRGEKSTTYLESAEAARGIRALYPEGKIVVSLRNPVERALSNYHFSVANGLETRTLRQTFLEEAPPPPLPEGLRLSTDPFAYLERSDYRRYLAPYLEVFPREQLHFVLFEKLFAGPEEIRELYRFLGADPGFLPPSGRKVINESARNDPDEPEVALRLRERFAPDLPALETLLGRSLDLWK